MGMIMRTLLKIKEKIVQIAGKYEVYLMPLFKFLLTFICISQINSKLGFMTKLASKPIEMIVALAGSFLPINLTLVILSLISVAHVYALSLEAAIIVLVLFLVLFLLYFRFSSNDSVAAMLVPISFVYRIPYVMPVSMGLVGTPSSMVSVGCGTLIYGVLHYISENAKALTAVDEEGSKLIQFKSMVDSILGDKDMYLYALAFAVTVLVVYILRRMAIDYAWYIAIAVGAVMDFLIILIGNSALGAHISAGSAFGGMLISIILNIILQFFCFNLNYNKTEKVQFEDDEYYYYVKAVPKNVVNKPKYVPTAKKPVQTKTQPKAQTVKPAAKPANKTSLKTYLFGTPIPTRKPQTSNKGPLGLSGGRPAGEGRLKAEARARSMQQESLQKEKIIEPLTEEDLNQ